MSQDDWPTGKQPKVTDALDADTVAQTSSDDRPRARRGAVDVAGSGDTAGAGASLVEASTPKASRRAEPRVVKSSHPRQGARDWLFRAGEAALALVVLAATVILVGRGAITAPAPPPRLNVTANLFCQNITGMAGQVSATADADLKWQPQGGAAIPGSAYFEHAVTSLSTLQGTGSVAGLVQFGSGGQIAASGCATPAASGYLQAGYANATLIMQNVDTQDAILNVSMLGAAGEVDPSDLVDLKIPAGTVKQINIGDYANGISPVAVRWQSTVGRVLAWVVASSSSGLDIVTPTSAASEVVVPGIPGGATVQVLISNPATVRVQAHVEAMTAQGRVALADADQLMVEAGSTTSVDLTSALSTDPTALVVTSDQPVAVSALVSHASDTATSPGVLVNQLGGVDAFGVAPAHSQLLISNPSNADTQVTVTMGNPSTTQTLPLAAGVTTAVAVPQPGAVRVSGAGVVAALVIRGGADDSSGMSVVPLAPDTARAGLTPAWIEAQPH